MIASLRTVDVPRVFGMSMLTPSPLPSRIGAQPPRPKVVSSHESVSPDQVPVVRAFDVADVGNARGEVPPRGREDGGLPRPGSRVDSRGPCRLANWASRRLGMNPPHFERRMLKQVAPAVPPPRVPRRPSRTAIRRASPACESPSARGPVPRPLLVLQWLLDARDPNRLQFGGTRSAASFAPPRLRSRRCGGPCACRASGG